MKVGLISLMIVSSISGCNNSSRSSNAEMPNQQELNRQLEDMNRKIMRDEDSQINVFVSRMRWPMMKTGTGLRYWIYKEGSGSLAKESQIATVSYTVSLLNGDTIYTSKEDGVKDFMIGQDNVESGIHEGILLMKVGDRSRFILPSYLAHGLSGDQDKIPPRHSVVYDLELLSLR